MLSSWGGKGCWLLIVKNNNFDYWKKIVKSESPEGARILFWLILKNKSESEVLRETEKFSSSEGEIFGHLIVQYNKYDKSYKTS